MAESVEKRIGRLQKAIDLWLSPDNYNLKEAIDRSVNEGLFSFEDIKHQILALKKTLKRGEFAFWADRAGLGSEEISKKVLCLHAGNLPLVGIQDILAVSMAGAHYLGKVSRKDPYLPATLLRVLKKEELIAGRWSTDLSNLSGERADAVLFSGAGGSVSDVDEALNQYGLADDSTPRLLRTAHHSIAFIEDSKPKTFEDLAEAVFRYGGKGCRSVAMVVAPFSLNSTKCGFTDYIEAFLMRNSQHEKAPPSLYHRYAYNRAAGKEQAWLDDFLIEQTDMEPSEPFVLHWIKGGEETLNDVVKKYRAGLQTVYVTDPDRQLPGISLQPELLSDAQQPPIWWKPDGVDPLEWLIKL